MEQMYDSKMKELGYNQLVCDIFANWEDVKDEILPPDRKQGTGNGTVHVFLGAADSELRKEFPAYYENVSNGEDTAVGAVKVKHYFLATNVLSMLGYICRYYFEKNTDFNNVATIILRQLDAEVDESGFLTTESLFKLSTGAPKLRPYFKQFDEKGVFHKIIRHLLLPDSSYKISLFKNEEGEYAALWLIGFNYLSNFEADSNDKYTKNEVRRSELPLQQIFYGAPGTGKSHKIKDDVDVKIANEKNLVFRTTFHPDSDYSTFVGAYKPTMRPVPNQYKAVAGKDEEITYSFVPQAFLQAYVAAWNNPGEKVFLVIEEINRGNCAQIFGDLFQLLDRDDNGNSEYPIKADMDLVKYLKGKDEYGQEVLNNKDGIKNDKLRIPSNLYIWATMNTSDQSLFPIDSAFKRRWDWVYMPISDAKKNYVIEIDNDQYDWWSFLTSINTIIESTTHSEDKKLGFFFAKAKDCRITAETFVSKVIFYLWNDVFKDNESNHKAFKDDDGEMLAFHKFFHEDGSVNTNVVIKFLQDLEVYPFVVPDDGTSAPSTTVPNAKRQRDNSRYSVNGTDGLNKAQMTREAFRLYIDTHTEADAQAIAQAWNGLGLKDYVRHLVETEEEFNTRTKDSSDPNKRATEFGLSNGEKIYLSTQFGIGNIGRFIDAVNNAGWNIHIDKQA